MSFAYTPNGFVPLHRNANQPGLDMGCESISFSLSDYMAQCPRYDTLSPSSSSLPHNGKNCQSNPQSPYCISSYVDRVYASPVRPTKSYDIGTKFVYDRSVDEVVDLRKYYSSYASGGKRGKK